MTFCKATLKQGVMNSVVQKRLDDMFFFAAEMESHFVQCPCTTVTNHIININSLKLTKTFNS